MKISHSDKALLITITGASFLILIFFFLGVKPYHNENPEEFIEIPVITEEELLEEQEEESETEPAPRAQTNIAYNASRLRNEARQFDNDDAIRKAIEEQQLGSVEELNEQNEALLAEKREQQEIALAAKKERLKENIEAREKERNASKGNRISTVTYDLSGREAIKIPNPVYTCDAVGIIVIDITVDSGGSIIKKDYNKRASSSSNGCLIDQALYYLSRAYFDRGSAQEQKGTVTYSFQG